MKQKNLKIASISAMLLAMIITITFNNNINSNASKAVVYKYAKDETVLRTKASSSASVSIVVVKGTKLKYISSVTKGDGTIYDKVTIVADKNYKSGHEGYVLRRQLSESEVESDKRLIYIKNKTKFVQEAMNILNTETEYNLKAPYRVGGYYGVKQKGKYVYDCSAFVSTLMKRVYGLDMVNTDKEKVVLNGKEYYNVWTTYTYMEEAKKADSIFEVVDRVTEPGKSINKKKLQIGDFIVGDAKKIRNGINHIMFYVGDGYIIHARGTGVVRERLTTDYYTRLETTENVKSGNVVRRFDKEIMVIRYKDRIINKK